MASTVLIRIWYFGWFCRWNSYLSRESYCIIWH